MCDFSEYGGASEEWLAVEKTLPSSIADFGADPKGAQATANAAREQVSATIMEKLGPQVHTADYTIPTRDGSTIEARSYRPVSKPDDELLPVYLYFHGGGFLFGNLNTGDATCANTAINTGVVVFSVNYRHTPDYTFPTAWNDTQDAFAWLHGNTSTVKIDPTKIVVGGISAGGHLAASLALEQHLGKNEFLRGLPKLAGQLLMIPATVSYQAFAEGPLKLMKSPEIFSMVENEHAPILSLATYRLFSDLLKVPKVPLTDTRINVLTAASMSDIKDMPPAMFAISGLDPLRDEGLLYAKLLAEQGVPTEVRLFKGVPHGFRMFGPALKASAEWDKCIEDGIAWALEKPAAIGKFEIKVVSQ